MAERLRQFLLHVQAMVLWPLIRVLFRAPVHGRRLRERPPGGLIVAPNHVSWIDPAFVQYAVYPHRVTFLMTELYYDMPLIGWYFRAVGARPVREDGPSVAGLKAARVALEAGEVVCIFPEGELTPDGTMRPGRRGVARLARRTGAAVLPVGIRGAEHVFSKLQRRPRRRRVSVHVGPLLWFDEPEDRDGEQRFLDRLMRTLSELAGKPTPEEHRSP